MSWWSDTKYPKARKEHQCQYCYKPIQVGEVYASWFGTDGADTWYCKAHVACHNVMREHCGKCEARDIDCYSDECIDYAILDEVCEKHCEKRKRHRCPESNAYHCRKMWEIMKEKYGDIRK